MCEGVGRLKDRRPFRQTDNCEEMSHPSNKINTEITFGRTRPQNRPLILTDVSGTWSLPFKSTTLLLDAKKLSPVILAVTSQHSGGHTEAKRLSRHAHAPPTAIQATQEEDAMEGRIRRAEKSNKKKKN